MDPAATTTHRRRVPASCCCTKREIRKLLGATTQKGLTVVPLELYFKDGHRQGRDRARPAQSKAHDKREDLKRRVAPSVRWHAL